MVPPHEGLDTADLAALHIDLGLEEHVKLVAHDRQAEIPLVKFIGQIHLYHAEALTKSGRAAEGQEAGRRAEELLRASGALK